MKVEDLVGLLQAAPGGEVDTAEAARLVALAHLRAVEGDALAALRELHQEVEGELVREALEASGWNLARAAAALGMATKASLQRVLGRHPELEAERQRRRGE